MHLPFPLPSPLQRRLVVAAVCAALAGPAHASEHAPEKGSKSDDAALQTMTEARQDLCSPTLAYEWLKAGNERFRNGKTLRRDYSRQRDTTAAGQFPFASVLSCMDSRTSSELIFDTGLGDLFNVRIAGNVVNDDVLGSLEYAHKIGGAKLLLVLGHTDCEAIKSAAEDTVMGNFTGVLARVRPSLAAIPQDGKPRTPKNTDFIGKASRMNVILAVRTIRERSTVLRDMQDRGQIDILGAFYDVKTGKVEFYRPLKGASALKHTSHLSEEAAAAPEESEEHETPTPAAGHGETAPAAAPAENAAHDEAVEHTRAEGDSEKADSDAGALHDNPHHADSPSPSVEEPAPAAQEEATAAHESHEEAPAHGPSHH